MNIVAGIMAQMSIYVRIYIKFTIKQPQLGLQNVNTYTMIVIYKKLLENWKVNNNIIHQYFNFYLNVYADGDMGIGINVKTAYMKQKHRMIWERRHGPVGSGMKTQDTKE